MDSQADPSGYTKVIVIVCLVGLLWLFSIYRLSRVWANTLNFDQVFILLFDGNYIFDPITNCTTCAFGVVGKLANQSLEYHRHSC